MNSREGMAKMMELVASAAPDGAVSRLKMVFDLMEIAEEVLAETLEKGHPTISRDEMKARLDNCFRHLVPNPLVHRPKLYRIHCTELARRAVNQSGSLDEPTDAEMMSVMSEMSLRTLPARRYALAYIRLFERWFPGLFDFDGIEKEEHIGEIDKALFECRRKVRQIIGKTRVHE